MVVIAISKMQKLNKQVGVLNLFNFCQWFYGFQFQTLSTLEAFKQIVPKPDQ